MKIWHEIISEKFYITVPAAGRINIWGKTKTGKKSQSCNGKFIYEYLKNLYVCKDLFKTMHVCIADNHIEIY